MIKVKLINPNCKPVRATKGSLAYDLLANIKEKKPIYPMRSLSIPTGIAVDTSNTDYAALLLPRSGLSGNFGVTLVNSVGLIDDDYRSEIICKLENKSNDKFTINPLSRICQLLFVLVQKHDRHIEFVNEINETGRGGFGSTGF